jgi:hypothetical protein
VGVNAEPDVRAAIGQLLAYRHFYYREIEEPDPQLLALFDGLIDSAFESLLSSLGISCLYRNGGGWSGSPGAVALNPTAAGFFSQLAKLQGQICATRFQTPDAGRFTPKAVGWLASSTDSSGRPLVTPTAGGFTAFASPDAPAASGRVGSLLGMDVFTDPSISTNLGAGTNQDIALMAVRDDIWLWESDLRLEAFKQPYSDTLSVLLRAYAYSALIPDRYVASLGQISGTGMVNLAFAI